MPKSLKCKLKTLHYQGRITDKELNDLLEKLEGHDRELISQSTCKDCISRKDAISTVNNMYNSCREYTLTEYRDVLIECFRVLCGVTPANRWIPIREKMHDRSGFYLVTTEYDEVYCDYYNENKFNRHEIIIAWMPMPDPYKGVADEEEIQTKGRMPDNLAKGLT